MSCSFALLLISADNFVYINPNSQSLQILLIISTYIFMQLEPFNL